MKDAEEILENTIRRCRERNIIISTYEEMAHPEKIPLGIKEELRNIGLWDLNPRNLFRINWKNEPLEFGGNFMELCPSRFNELRKEKYYFYQEWHNFIGEFNKKTGVFEKYQ